METYTLRRSQSLKSLSGNQEGSRVMPFTRKSVSQLVQQYQSFGDLRFCEEVEQKHKVHGKVEAYGGQLRSRESGGSRLGQLVSETSFPLTRSRSMDHLLPRDAAGGGTSALRALFESRSTLQQDYFSSPRLNTTAPVLVSKAGSDRPLVMASKGPSIPAGNTGSQRKAQFEWRTAISVSPDSSLRISKYSHDGKKTQQVTHRDSQSKQGSGARPSTTASVRDRSALYLSKVAATDSTGIAAQPEFVISSGQRSKASKMADIVKQVRVSEPSHDDDDLPPPPPPQIPPRPLDYDAPSCSVGLPVPPPKETFTTFYQQRQKNELKRLFKHIHPDLRENIDDAVDDELVEVINSEAMETVDSGYSGEVQSMRWIFENWTLDNIGDPHATKKLLDEEGLKGGDVRGTSSRFEHVEGTTQSGLARRQSSIRGDVRTSTWLFETQPFDSLNKLKTEEGEVVEAVLKEPVQSGDVRGARLLFESKTLSDLGRCDSIEDYSFLKLKSELQEQKGDVQKTVKLFQAEPCCAIRDDSGNMHEVRSICREEIKSGDSSSARWLFETQPLGNINKGAEGVRIIRGISLEESQRGGVDGKRWMFETQTLDNIQEGTEQVDKFEGTLLENRGDADVGNTRNLFETRPLATLKGDSAEKMLEKEEILGGDVKTSLWLFETQPMETLSDSYEVGHLQKITLSADEQGAVKGKKEMFENYSTAQSISVREQEIERGDVKSFKHLFETIPLSSIAHTEDISDTREIKVTEGKVKGNKTLFETTPLYAIKDCSGNLHEVTTVSREESIKGNVQNYKWMFETRPIDQFVEVKGNVKVIKGITREVDTAGDVKMAKWLFETQTMDGINSRINQTEPTSSTEVVVPPKGDVKTCRWLFETQPMDILYDKSERTLDKDDIKNTNVKSFTWLFESQPLDSIKDCEEHNLTLCNTVQDSIKPEFEVQTVKHLFETETLDKIRKDPNTERDVRLVSQVDVQSGDVSRVKELFESQSLDEIGSEMMTATDGQDQSEPIHGGSVHKFTWLFENRPIHQINERDHTGMQRANDVEGGDVYNKKFIFETFSLDKIHDQPFEETSDSVEKPESSVDVKFSTMMFESQPLYAIRDKEGQFHEVTTVKKEEVMSGDVRGARWMFETKPLDAIKADNEVYVIRAVTQEDIKKGDVKSARWKFETQPLDSFASPDTPAVADVEDIGKNNVQLNKQIFESDQAAQKNYVRMVSVTDVQQGDVRTSTWLFENQPIDSLKGEPKEQGRVNTVQREDKWKGDVKRSTFLFESQPLDKIREADDALVTNTDEDRPKADVKSTTWLFETTPLDKIAIDSVADTLTRLHELASLHSSGIIIEANEIRNVTMAKYQLASQEGIQIQKEEVIEGNIQNIMLKLLCKPTLMPQITLIREMEKGDVNTTVVELPDSQQSTPAIYLERDQRIQNIAQMIESLLIQSKPLKKGIIMQESDGGQAEMTVYSLVPRCETKTENQDIEWRDIKSTIGDLIATSSNQRTASSCRIDEYEKGNVNLYKSCIEKGDLQYLKSLQTESLEEDQDVGSTAWEPIEIVRGDVKEAQRCLYQQKELVERTICDVLPGDVKNAKKVFSSDCIHDVETAIPKEEIIPGDIASAKQQLAAKQPMLVEKEEVVAGDIKATMQSLERAKQQSLCVEREAFKPGTIYDMDLSTQGPEIEGSQTQKEEIISGDVKAAKRSLEMAKSQSMRLERETIVPGKIYNLNVSAQEQSSSTVTETASLSASRGQQIRTTFQKVSGAVKDQKSHNSFQSCLQGEVSHSSVRGNYCAQNSLLSPLFKPECDVQMSEEETEAGAFRGDVKAAIRSLQSAAKEHKLPDKEDIVKGNMQLALQSLEKSSVNVSKGDFKAAMIYRNSGRGCSGNSSTVRRQGVVVSMPPSDNELCPSISVTFEEPQSVATQNTTTTTTTTKCLEIINGNPKSSGCEGTQSPGLPQKPSEKPQNQKPALPPKPEWTKSSHVNEQSIQPCSAFQVTCPNSDQSPVNLLNANLSNQSANLSSDNPQGNNNLGTVFSNNDILHDTCDHKFSDEAMQSSNDARATNGTQRKDLKIEEIQAKRNTMHSTGEFSKSLTDKHTNSGRTETKMDKNVIQRINVAEEIQKCIEGHGEDNRNEMNMGFQATLENFGRRGGQSDFSVPVLSKKVKVVNNMVMQETEAKKSTSMKEKSIHTPKQQQCSSQLQEKAFEVPADAGAVEPNTLDGEQQRHKDKVVLRKKKVRETEDERRQRLSVHKDEIMKGNVKAAMEIFENLRKREELKTILSQVQEMEGETSSVDVGSLKTAFEDVPAWIVTPSRTGRKNNQKEEKKIQMETCDDDLESTSSVETAFEDLEKASREIMDLKEQTLAKLIDIEESIKKALYSVSNLKSEADIAGLSGLFDESLKSEQSCQPSNNIRKISIVSSKAKPEPNKETGEGSGPSKQSETAPTQAHRKPLIRQCSSPSSPSFISIHSAARKQTDPPKSPMSTFKPKMEGHPHSCHGATANLSQMPVTAEPLNQFQNPASPRRKVSVIEVKTIPEAPVGIIGTKTVSETYQQTDSFGNSFVSSKMSTVVTKQSNSQTTLFDVVGSPARYEVVASPLMRRCDRSFAENVLNNSKEEGTVFVTFSQPNTDKH